MSFLYEHFYSKDCDGFLGNVSITLIGINDLLQAKKKNNE